MRRGGWYFDVCVVALWGATFFLGGCAGHPPVRYKGIVPESTPAATELLSSLMGINRSLVAFKGIGTVSLVQKGQSQKFRAAWAAAGPDKLRLQFFSPTGQPVLTIACDGTYYYFLSPEKEGVVKKRVTAEGLKHYIDIPIGVPTLFSLFCGRPPAYGEKPPTAVLEKDALQANALVLIDPSGESVDTIHLNEGASGIREIDRTTRDGALVWRCAFEDDKLRDSYLIPGKITLFAENGDRVRIEVERFWANPSMSKEMFVISGP